MEQIKTEGDSRAFRNSTHLAGIDVDIYTREKGKMILTIKRAYSNEEEVVNGKKVRGVFVEFLEPFKNMKINSTKRDVIANILRSEKNLARNESFDIKNWTGLKIELTFNPTTKMGKETTGGIDIVGVPFALGKVVSDIEPLAKLNKAATLDEARAIYTTLSKEEKALPSVAKLIEELKTKLK